MKILVDLDGLTLEEILANFDLQGAEEGLDLIREKEGYSIYRKPGHLGLFLCFNQGYCGHEIFTGVITKSGTPVTLSSESTLEFVQSLFDAPPVANWFDEMEHCMEFRRSGIDFEFSWLIEEKGLALQYLIMERMKVKDAPPQK